MDGALVISAFSGQGIPSGQLAELRRVAKQREVLSFLRRLSDELAAILASGFAPELIATHFLHGLDIAQWATSKAKSPGIEYLDSISITLVLTFAIQLACFRFAWVGSGSYPAKKGACGHSQGLAAAMVVALSRCERSFEDYACRFARVLVHLGLAIAEQIPAEPSYALAIVKEDVAEVERLVRKHNAAGGNVHLVVRNGHRACTVTGVPQALTAFAESGLLSAGASCRWLPVRAPFHCDELMSSARDVCLDRTAADPSIPSSELQRPCWSCVNGHDVSTGGGLPSLQAYLVHAVACDPVDWPRTVVAVAEHWAVAPVPLAERTVIVDGSSCTSCMLVDFGPGGGSGVARMTNVVAAELGLQSPLDSCGGLSACYFTQCTAWDGIPGPLPQSWLQWLRTGDHCQAARTVATGPDHSANADGTTNAAATGNAAADDASGSAPAVVAVHAVTPSKKGEDSKKGEYVYFSERLKVASGGGEHITFTPAVLEAISPELKKVRHGRKEAMARPYPAAMRALTQAAAFTHLRAEATLAFDPSAFPLREAFASLLGLASDLPLHRLHERYHSDSGAKGNREEKLRLLAPLTDAIARQAFLAAYESLCLQCLGGRIRAVLGCDTLLFQSFPCVRVHRPGEFSIGPHCDAQYQAPDGNLNYYVPLTEAIWGTNSLYLESAPGREDWHPLSLSYGELATFYGVYCSHFTAENTTTVTRVSLDFRLVPGGCYAPDVTDQPVHFRAGEYYSEAAWDASSGRFEVRRRGQPYWRHGFPHTNR